MSEQNQSQGQTKKCPKCGEEVQSSAKVCKHCQADLRSFFAKHKIITGFLILIVIIIFSSVISSYNKTQDTMNEGKKTVADNEKQLDKYQAAVDNSSNKKEATPAEPAKSTPQVAVTSVNISKEYSENEVAADEKYKGKLIQISGKVSSIDNGTFDNEIIVKLSDGQYDFSGAMCYMKDSEKEKVLAFKKGQQVTLIGTGDSATLKSPVLKDCVVK